jgi:hypothetical protein
MGKQSCGCNRFAVIGVKKLNDFQLSEFFSSLKAIKSDGGSK